MNLLVQSRFLRRGAVLLALVLGLGGVVVGCGEQTPPATEEEEMPEYAEQMKSMMEQRQGL